MSDNLTILSIGLACVSGQKVNYHIDYRNPDFTGLFYQLTEGGYAIDKSGPLEDNPGLAIKSPMCDCRLVGDQVDRLSDQSIVIDALAEDSGGYGPLARLAQEELANRSDDPGPFDYISPQAYAEWWADKGAVVGQRHLQYIEWFDGVRTEIVEPT